MRRTRQRDAILRTLETAGRPLSPAEIVSSTHAEGTEINLATVYRNIKAMGAAGELSAVECVGQPARYEVAGLDHHHHFLCEICDRLFDLPGCGAAAVEKLAPDGFEVREHHIQLTGRCAECSDRASPA